MNPILAVVIMAVMGLVGLFIGISGNDPFGGAILFALISGIACIIQTINKKQRDTDDTDNE